MNRRPTAAFLATVAITTVAYAQPAAPTIALNFPGPVPVQTLVDYVSARLGINIVYDPEQVQKAGSVVLRAPERVTADELTALLANVLATKRLALVRDERTGTFRVTDAAGSAAPGRPRVEQVRLKYADAAKLAPQVKQLVTATAGRDQPPVEVSFDARTNQLILVGPPAAVDDAVAVAKLVDVPAATERGTLQFYKLTNATAADVLDTIRDLEGRAPSARRQTAPPARNDISSGAATGTSVTGSGSGVGTAGQVNAGQPGTGSNSTAGSSFGQTASGTGGNGRLNVGSFAAATAAAEQGPTDILTSGGDSGSGGSSHLGGEAVTADPNTNTIIVRGGPDVQRTYRQLIEQLDRRRPQVLLEATVVTIDTTHNFSFGVELAARSLGGGTQVISFSQFGLSTVNPANGSLTPVASSGGTAAVVGTGVANAVIHALAQDTRVRVQSAPRVLVNDNATGLLASIAEQPFTSVNASNTVATTSFGGYADAGTTITLTPHISQGDYLQLEYAVELSSFTGPANAATGSPPPRQTDRVESSVTIPDGSTIIVGGLNRRDLTREVDAVPILGQIPFLRFLFSSRSNDVSTQTLFVFLRPTILRDESFLDLRNLSEGDLKDAGVPPNFPQSKPVVMR